MEATRSTRRPEKLSDGFRNEKCTECGGVIGYADFDTEQHGLIFVDGTWFGQWTLSHKRCGGR